MSRPERATRPVQGVLGPIAPDALGRTLMHEHLVIGFPGWDSDPAHPGPDAIERLRVAVERIQEIQELGISTLVDPCPNDLGRDHETMAKAAHATGFRIIAATGLYKEHEGGAPFWRFRGQLGGGVEAMTELFVRELQEGIGDTGIRAGIIKVGTGLGAVSDYERQVLEAAARASRETGAPITTHTDGGTLGDAQQRILTGHGVPAHRILVGHSCGTTDTDYHLGIARGGSFLGFDRFGLEMIVPDADRVAALLRLLARGAGDRVVVSHDSVWCWRGEPIPPAVQQAMEKTWNPGHFCRRILPMLREGGAGEEALEALLRENPRRFFAGDPLPALA